MDEVNETLEFFKFAKKPNDYNGVVTFVLTDDEQREHVRSVVVGSTGQVQVENGTLPATSCVVRMTKNAFLDVYNGSMHPKTAILGGHLHVDGYRYNELRRFLMSFDFSSAKWRQFYQARDNSPTVMLDSLLSSWRSMLIPAAQAQSSSMSLHLSRRMLTQSTIQNIIDGNQPVQTSLMPPMMTTHNRFTARRRPFPSSSTIASSIQFRRQQSKHLTARLLSTVPRLTKPLSREHADFMHRML